MKSLQEAIPEREISDTLKAISSYEAGQNEVVDIEDDLIDCCFTARQHKKAILRRNDRLMENEIK